jgi:hypothetical protein
MSTSLVTAAASVESVVQPPLDVIPSPLPPPPTTLPEDLMQSGPLKKYFTFGLKCHLVQRSL